MTASDGGRSKDRGALKKRAWAICVVLLLLGLAWYFLVPAMEITVTSIDYYRDFTNRGEQMEEIDREAALDALTGRKLWRTARRDFPGVSGKALEVLAAGKHGGETVQVHMICYASGRVYFRVGPTDRIYTTYSSGDIYDALGLAD